MTGHSEASALDASSAKLLPLLRSRPPAWPVSGPCGCCCAHRRGLSIWPLAGQRASARQTSSPWSRTGRQQTVRTTTTSAESLSAQQPPSLPPLSPPVDYHFPFGNPSLLIATLPSRQHAAYESTASSSSAGVVLSPRPSLSTLRPTRERSRQSRESRRLRKAETLPLAHRHHPPRQTEQQPDGQPDAVSPTPTATTTAETATDGDAPPATTATEQPRWSEPVYVLGSDPRATYLAHMLSGLPHSPPVRLLLSGRAMTNWLEEGRRVRLVRAGVVQPRARVVAELLEQPTDAALLAAAAAADAPPNTQRRVRSRHRHIENLVVTLPCARSISAIRWLRHRIDHRTTICLLQSGLGVAERLNELFFADEASRPRYVLGYMTHDLGYGNHDRNFSLTELVPGILRLTAYYPDTGAHKTGGADVSGGELQLVRLMGLTPTLGAGGYEVDEFLRWKLPEMVSTAAVEPIATVLDLAPNLVWRNGEARALVEGLIHEMVAVVARLPETQGSAMLAEFVQSGMLARQAQQGRQKGPPPAHEDVDGLAAQHRETRLRSVRATTQQSTVECRMAKLVREGRVTDIHFLNGWFVRRGREVGVNCPLNEMVMRLVRAKQMTGRAQMDSYVPLVTEDAAAAEQPASPRQPVSTDWSNPQRQRRTTTAPQWTGDEDSGEAEDRWTGPGETMEPMGGYYY